MNLNAISGVQSNMFSPVNSANRSTAVQAVAGAASRQMSSMQIMRVYVLQEAPRTFIRSQRFAQAQGLYREDGDPNRYQEWAGQENQQSSVTGLRQWKPQDEDFIGKHLERLNQWNNQLNNETLVQQLKVEDAAETAPEETGEANGVEEDTPSTGEMTNNAPEREPEAPNTVETAAATSRRQETQGLSPQMQAAVAGVAGAQLVR